METRIHLGAPGTHCGGSNIWAGLVSGDEREILAAEGKELMGKLRAYGVAVGYGVWLKSRASESRRQVDR